MLTILAFLVLPSILLETVTDDPTLLGLANVLDWGIWIGFGAVLVGLYAATPQRNTFIQRHAFDVLIVVLTPPVAPEVWQAFRALRILRFLRLAFAGVRLHRYMRGIARASVVGPAALLLLIVVVGAATVVHLIEPDAAPTLTGALWWGVSRVTALGDGGIVLATPVARGIELVVVLCGLAFLSLITAAIATVFVRAEAEDDPSAGKLDEVLARLQRIEQRMGGADDVHVRPLR